MELKDRIAVVTGGARGIGFAIAEAFLAEDARAVAIVDLDQNDVDLAVAQLGERATGYAVDVSDRASVVALVDDVEGRLGPIDLFVSNAGIGSGMGLEADAQTWDRVMGVNVMAHVYAAEAVLPSMLERGEGYLLSTASAAGLLGQIADMPYSVTKHAAVAVAEWLSITYGDQGIKVSCLCPQGVRTDLLAQAMGHTAVEAVVAQGLIEPEDVAAATIAGLRREQFLILPHPEVADYYKYRAADTDGWLSRMRAIQARIVAALNSTTAASANDN